jgi:uncharacterized membrane protein
MAERSTPEAKETGRIEAFSDGVFAIAVTLLVLEIHAPGSGDLKAAVLHQWPSFAAYAISFMIILVMWVNHHAVFRLLRRTDRWFQMANGVLLMVVTFLNYPTALVASTLGTANQRFAALLYNGTCCVVAAVSFWMWRYAVHERRLLDENVEPRVVAMINNQYRLGPLFFLLVFALTYWNACAGLLGNLFLWLYFAFTGESRPLPAQDKE